MKIDCPACTQPMTEVLLPVRQIYAGDIRSMDNRTERIYALCKWLRNVEADPKDCNRCPARVETPYGPGMPGCYAVAEEAYEIAHGCREEKVRVITDSASSGESRG